MTTIDQIKEEAVEAAHRSFCDAWDAGALGIESMRAAIDAYEKAMWRPASEASEGTVGLVAGGLAEFRQGEWVSLLSGRSIAWQVTHFRPLPKPPEKP